jgi:hypothetical protein
MELKEKKNMKASMRDPKSAHIVSTEVNLRTGVLQTDTGDVDSALPKHSLVSWRSHLSTGHTHKPVTWESRRP